MTHFCDSANSGVSKAEQHNAKADTMQNKVCGNSQRMGGHEDGIGILKVVLFLLNSCQHMSPGDSS